MFGIDKFMSEVRALTNITGNGVATVVVSWWEGELDRTKMAAALGDVDLGEAILVAETKVRERAPCGSASPRATGGRGVRVRGRAAPSGRAPRALGTADFVAPSS